MEIKRNNILTSVDGNLNGPAIRNLYLKKASEEYNDGNHLNSIFYQAEAIGIGFRSKFFRKTERNIDNICADFAKTQTKFLRNNKLVEFAKEFTKKYKVEKNEEINENFYETDPKKGMQNVMEFFKNCPKQWTVLQLCRNFNPYKSFSVEPEIAMSPDAIFVTILKHPRYDLSIEPICFKINTQSSDESETIYDQFYGLIKLFKKRATSNIHGPTKEDRQRFWKEMDILNKDVQRAMKALRKTIGPWFCLFTGDVCEDDRHLQAELFKEVDDFCLEHNFDQTTRIILSFLVRQVNLLSETDIAEASKFLTSDHCSEDTIQTFLESLQSPKNAILKFSPCLIIVDEMLDQFFWEMLNPEQEICRLSSFHVLQKLYNKYSKNIIDGYLSIPIQNGNVLINPDKTLERMEDRMFHFFSYWLPHWRMIRGEIPTETEIVSMITSADAYAYCGHGSSLQYLNGHKITYLETNSVIFLFGCESVRLRSEGLHTEMIGAHLYFHSALCPAVIGSLVIGLDFQFDMLSSKLLSTWIPSKRKVHWSQIDKIKWRDGIDILSNVTTASPHKYEKSLPAVLSKLRTSEDATLYSRVSLVLRGLPIYNKY